VLTPELVTLSGPGPHKLDIRGAIQNSDTGSFTTTAVRASMTVSPVGVSPGSMKPGEAMDSGAEFSVGAYRLYIDGKCVREIDQENGVDKINGEDVAASASARKALGL
jgi:P2 family phage contractile tail tube protein